MNQKPFTSPLEKLKGYCQVGQMHAEKLSRALATCVHLEPLHRERLHLLSDPEAFALDSLASRFTKLQDLMGAKIFPLLLIYTEGELNQTSYIDKLNLLEKKGYLPSVQAWQALRLMRNEIAHEYPDDEKIQENLKALLEKTRYLLALWQALLSKINQLGSVQE
jgi:hypothetical protein